MVEATDVAADWNVIVTLPEATFREARKFLRRWRDFTVSVFPSSLSTTLAPGPRKQVNIRADASALSLIQINCHFF
jgi:hypothetical protein